MRWTIPCGARPEPHDSATRRAVHAQVVADPAHDDRPRVEPDAHLEREPALRLELPAVLADRARSRARLGRRVAGCPRGRWARRRQASIPWRPADGVAAVYLTVTLDGGWRGLVLGPRERVAVAFFEDLPQLRPLTFPFERLGDVGGRLFGIAEIDGVKSRERVFPVEAMSRQTSEDHRVDRRQVGPLRHPDRAEIEIHVVVVEVAALTAEQLGDEIAGAAKGADVHEAAVRGDDVVVVGKDIPQAPPHQVARLTNALDGWILPGRANLLERGLAALVGPSPAGAGQRPEVLMDPQRFPMKLLDRGMEHGEQGRALPSRRRDLRENVVTTETERKELREDGLTLAFR